MQTAAQIHVRLLTFSEATVAPQNTHTEKKENSTTVDVSIGFEIHFGLNWSEHETGAVEKMKKPSQETGGKLSLWHLLKWFRSRFHNL